MKFSAQDKPRKRAEGIEARALPNGSTLLFDAASSTAYPISESAATVWMSCDGQNNVASMVDALCLVYEVPRETVARDVEAVLEQFAQIGLLEPV
jgi:hypothetical protein